MKLPAASTERIRIQTFGSTERCDKLCGVVHLEVRVEEGRTLNIAALVVPVICSPLTSQPINASSECYEHLAGLKLADSSDSCDALEVDVLIGSDWYWSLVTGRVTSPDQPPFTPRWGGSSRDQRTAKPPSTSPSPLLTRSKWIPSWLSQVWTSS